MLAAHFGGVVDKVDAVIGNIETVLGAIDNATKLPFINAQIGELDQLTTSVGEFREGLHKILDDPTIEDSSVNQQLTDQLFAILSPAGILKNNAATDVHVDVNSNTGAIDIKLDLGATVQVIQPSTLNTGVDAIPFAPEKDTKGSFEVSVYYTGFQFGYDPAPDKGAYFQKDPGQLQLVLKGDLPHSFTVGLGFMNFKATDLTPNDASHHDFQLTLTSPVTASGIETPKIGSPTDGVFVNMHLDVQTPLEGVPQIQTDFILNWNLPSGGLSPSLAMGGGWGTPQLEFDHVQISVGSMMGSIATPIARHIKEIMEPLEPVFDLLEKPLPGLNDISQEFDGPTINLLNLVENLPQALPPQLVDVIHSVTTLRNYHDKIKSVANLTGWVDLGNFRIWASQNGGNLLDAATAHLIDAATNLLSPLSHLITPDGNINVQYIKDKIREAIGNDDIADVVIQVIDQFAPLDEEDGITFTYPIITDPGNVAVGMLLGQDKDLVTAEVKLNFLFDKVQHIHIIPIFGIALEGHAEFHAYANFGYDTRGFREAIEPFYRHALQAQDDQNPLGGFDPSKTVDGFWIGKDMKVDVIGGMHAGPEIDVEIAEGRIDTGFTVDFHANISNPSNPPKDKIRPFAGDLGDRLFDVRGGMVVDLRGHLEVGGDVPGIGFVGWERTWTFASVPIFTFEDIDTRVPGEFVAPPIRPIHLIAYYPELDKELRLSAGSEAFRTYRGIASDNINEDFIVKHVSHLHFNDVYIWTPVGLIFIPDHYEEVYDVTAFGVTQRFQGEVHTFSAYMEDGTDSIKVIDDENSNVLYKLYGGSGDDTIDVDGHVDAQLHGDDGEDKLDAGNGNPNTTTPTTIHGGLDNDIISFGDGLLSNMTPGDFGVIRDSALDVSLDTILIDNSKSRTPFDYEFDPVDYDPRFNYNLSIGGGGAYRNVFFTKYDAVLLKSGYGNDFFGGFPTAFSTIYGGGGDDFFDLDPGDAGLPVRESPFLFPGAFNYISVYGGDGHDTVVVTDPREDVFNPPLPARTFLLSRPATSGGSAQIQWTESPTRGYWINLGSVDETQLLPAKNASKANQIIQVNSWDESDLTLEAGEVRLVADAPSMWDTKITIQNTPRVTVIDSSIFSSYSHAGIDATGPYIDTLLNHRMRVVVDEAAKFFSFENRYTTVDLSPELLNATWSIAFHNGLVAFNAPQTPAGSTPVDYNYRVEPKKVVVNFKSFEFDNISQLVMNGGAGNDQFKILGHPTGVFIAIEAGPGNDTLIVDEQLDTGNRTWNIGDGSLLIFNQLTLIAYEIENSQYLAGSGNDEITVGPDFKSPIVINAGGGADSILIKGDESPTTFHASARIEGGGGDDSFDWHGAANVTPTGTNPVTIDGGTGFNVLTVEDVAFDQLSYQIYPDRMKIAQVGQDLSADFTYDNINGANLSFADYDHVVDIFGISADISANFRFGIHGNGSDNIFKIHPRDAAGTQTMNGDLAISGGGGTTQVIVDDLPATTADNYSIQSFLGFPITYLTGLGLGGLLLDGDVGQLLLRTGSADDTFNIESYTSSTALTIAAGVGNDTLNITPTSKNFDTSMAVGFACSFDGGGGSDSLNLFNDNSSSNWLYTSDAGGLTAGHFEEGTALSFIPTHVENTSVSAGGAGDIFNAEYVANAATLSLAGGGGPDSFFVTSNSGNAKLIQGQVVVDGGTDSGTLYVNDQSDTAGAVVHIEGDSIVTVGAAPGDTLFGIGGSLRYQNITAPSFIDAVNFFFGNGADTIYVTPESAASIFISAGDPTNAPGDRLNLNLAQVQNAVVQNFGNGSGEVTSASRNRVHWTGIETPNSGYIAPISFLVTNTLDSGPGSLRQAMLDANATPNIGGPDVIRFAIQGFGAHTIRPLSLLPTITDSVVIDGTSQPGYAGTPVIELDGTQGANVGLNIASSGNTIRGLAINRFVGGANAEIWITGPGGNVIQGNYIGTNLAGNAVFPFASQAAYGVIIFGSDNNLVGTNGDGVNDAAEGNVIAGNNTAGILFENSATDSSENNVIAGNRIGTSADGNTALGNGRMGVFLIQGTGNRIGTNSDGVSDTLERNIISGHGESGVYISDNSNIVAGNYIGTNAAGTAALPNNYGVGIQAGSDNRIGGTGPGSGNTIAFNNFDGVLFERGGTGNAILGNSIFANTRLGINLNDVGQLANGVTLNDTGDVDAGTNNLQNFPQITTAISSSTQTTIAGILQSTPGKTFRIELFASPVADPSGFGEGQTYLGFISAITDAAGNANFVTTLSTLVPVGQYISATATDASNNTSEFSASFKVVASSSLPNIAPLTNPITGGAFLVLSPVGSSITASVATTAGTAPPAGIEFPFGFVNFTVRGISPGVSANVTITGLDISQLRNYYKYGKTPANGTAHWYNFLFGQATDRDSAVGTGMEFVGGNMVLHFIDGKRGDDDLTANGVIVDIGGPVRNHAPVPVNDTATINEDTTLSVAATALKANDKDADSDALRVTGVSNAANGSVSLTNGMVKFIPAADFNGAAGFDYTVSDGLLAATGHFTVTVKEVNDAPTANPDTATLAEDGSIDIEVRTNDSKGPANESGQTLTVKSASALHGTVTINSNGTLRYRPATNYFGTDTISYTVIDNGTTAGVANPLTSSSTVAVTVTSVNDAPAGKDLIAAVTEDGKVEIQLGSTDVETPESAILFTVTSLPTLGQLSSKSGALVQIGDRFTGSPTFVYEPGAAREGAGTDGFKYMVTDNSGLAGALIDDATVSINITKAVDDNKVTLDASGVVRIGGTSGNDTIVAAASGKKLQVTINGKNINNNISLTSVREIRTWGRAGSDKISVFLDVPTLLHGGAGNDEILGGSGSNLVFGDAGNDKLTGGVRNDLLVGGDGADTLFDALGNNLVVGGNVSNQFTVDFLRQVLQQWDTSRTQNTRFKQGLIDDNSVDSLFDGLGDDWFLLGHGDLKTDLNPNDHDVVTVL